MTNQRQLRRWLVCSSCAWALASPAAARAACNDCAAPKAKPPVALASLDGIHFEPVPLKRSRLDPVTGKTRLVVVPKSKYKSMRWVFPAGPVAMDTTSTAANR